MPFDALKHHSGIFSRKQIQAYKQKYKYIFAPQIFPKEDENVNAGSTLRLLFNIVF